MLDYSALGIKCGIEIHQQLDTREKLFCGCPTLLRDVKESNLEFFRYLRPTVSEMGEIDRAALEEAKVTRRFFYKAYDTTCLVEYDEEPPRELNQEALDITLIAALLLNMKIVDEVHTMRKIVIDGSNTSGFQRTALVATNGFIDTGEGRVGINVLCLEEEAAQKIEEKEDTIVYSLDRLSIPLVEIGTGPDIISPTHAKIVAEQIGMLLRSTGKVKRGIGTIRQDVNISIARGARVEIKGVQALELIDTIVEREVSRQVNLLKIMEELQDRGAWVSDKIIDVTDVFQGTKSKVIQKALQKGGVLALNLAGFSGLVGQEIQPGRRLGTEFSDRARKAGVGGIFHTDELPDYGITQEEVDALKEKVGAKEEDCVILVAGMNDRAKNALEAVMERAKQALEMIPEETRRGLPDGNSEYMRPLPGAARMYPETDVPPVLITKDRIKSIRLPELFSERKSRYVKQYGLKEDLAWIIAKSPNFTLFEEILANVPEAQPTLVIKTLETTLNDLRKEGERVEDIQEHHLFQLFRLLHEGKIAKEALEEILRQLTKNPEQSTEDAASRLGLIGLEAENIEAIIDKIIAERKDFIKEKGMNAVQPLMGVVMKELRGKAKGETVSNLLKEKIAKMI